MKKITLIIVSLVTAVACFAAVNQKGTWFENRDEVEGKIEHLSSDGDLTGDVTGDVTGDLTGSVTGGMTTNYTFLSGGGTTGQVWFAGGVITNLDINIGD